MNSTRILTIILILILIIPFSLQAENNTAVDDYLVSARKAYYRGELEQSKKLYQKILDIEPQHRDAVLNLIQINRELGKISQLEHYYNILLGEEPGNAYYRFQLGIVCYQQGDYHRSLDFFQEINYEEIKSQLTTREKGLFFYYRGENYLQVGEVQQALKSFSTGIEIYPELTLNYTGIGDIYREKGEYSRAIEYYEQALRKDYSLSELYPLLASCYQYTGDVDSAYNYLKRSINSGVGGKEVEEKMLLLEKKYPRLLETEKDEKRRKRIKINWANVEPLESREELPVIRIGLVDKVDTIYFQTKEAFVLRNLSGEIVYSPPDEEGEWKVTYNRGKFQFYREEELQKEIITSQPLVWDYNLTTIYDITYGNGYFWSGTEDRQYRGKIELYPVTADSFNLINILNLEEYLFSVVPAEIPAWWPNEALMAQAVAARSYVLKNRGRYSHKGYDLCSGVNCMVYSGVGSETNRTTRAVLETSGEVAVYEGKIIEAVFSSNSGGYTESSADVWGFDLPYLKGTSNMLNDSYDFPLQPYELFTWLLENPSSYGGNNRFSGSNTYRWTRKIPISYLEKKYSLDLQNIIIRGRGKGGSVEEVLLVGREKKISIKRDKIRSAFGGLRSNRFVINKVYTPNGDLDSLHFFGAGWGHNVGMDQTAAAGMAAAGYTYKEIIYHFYPGTSIESKY